MRVLLFVFSLLVSLAVPVVAAIPDVVTKFQLDNGMDVVVIEDHRAPVVVHMVWYKSGSVDEKPGVSGVAHFLEHLLFKQTKTLESGEFSRTVAANGGSDNAFTSYDYTAYYQRIAADRLELMMRMESDRMVNLDLTEDDILTERDVILEERNMRVENDPGALFREQRNAALFLNHRYGVPVIGWKHEVEKLTLADALDYYHQYYAPNNAILVVAGDVVPSEVKSLAETYYGVLPANPDLQPRTRPQEPPHTSARRMSFLDPRVTQDYVTRAYIAPERDSGDQKKAAALLLLAQLLGGGQTSVLTQKLQFETQTAVYAGSFYSGTSVDDGTFSLVVVPSQGVTLENAEKAMDTAIQDFMRDGVDQDHLDRLKMQIRAQTVYAQDNTQSLANIYGEALAIGLTIDDIHAWPDILQSITADDILSVAQEVLKLENSVTGYMLKPEEAAQ
mgnify:CR=1 FL=1